MTGRSHPEDEDANVQAHREAALTRVPCAVLTLNRPEQRNAFSGRMGKELGEAYVACDRDDEVRAVVLTGGTGVAPRDVTPETVGPLLDRVIPGFGELFRALSYQEIGSAAMMSRATAGTVSGKVIFVLPGSENAVRLAMTRLIIPELTHVVQQVRK